MLLLVACAGVPTDTADTATVDLVAQLTEPGPEGIGYRESSVTYTGVGGERTLRVATWYPTDDTSGFDAAYLGGLVEAEGVIADAEPQAGPFPVVVFSHGHQGYAEAASFLMEHLASHGWLVVSPDHTNNTTFDSSDRDTEIYLQRPQDLSAVLDATEAAFESTGTVVAMGHSFGGLSLYAVGGSPFDAAGIAKDCAGGSTDAICSTMTDELATAFEADYRDDRVDGLLPMASGDFSRFGAASVAAVQVPVFMMDGSLDEGKIEQSESYWSALGGSPHRRLHLVGGHHNTFTDYSGVLEEHDELIDPEEGWRILGAYALAFARQVDGDAAVDGFLEGEPAISEAVQLSW